MSRSNNNNHTSLGTLACDAINKNPITNFNQRQKQQVFSVFASFRFLNISFVGDCFENRIGECKRLDECSYRLELRRDLSLSAVDTQK